jgi:hypothetical protein
VLCSSSITAKEQSCDGPKTKDKAVMCSLAATLLPVTFGTVLVVQGDGSDNSAAAAAGFVIASLGALAGPGTGHLYAGNKGRFYTGIAIRAAAGGMFALGACTFEFTLSGGSETPGAAMLMLLGALAYLISMVGDIATVGRSVDKYNEEHALTDVTLKPSYDPDAKTIGMILSLHF